MRIQSKILPAVLLPIGLLASSPLLAQQTQFDAARSNLEKWVEARQLISKERADWEARKQTIQETIKLLQTEFDELNKRISSAEEDTSAADKEREELINNNNAFKTAALTVDGRIGTLEARIRNLAKFFPADLAAKEGVKALIKRIPADPKNTSESLSARMQNIVGLLTEAEKYNGMITVNKEIRTAQGQSIEVSTIYIGLGQGFYVDKSGTIAGTLTPGPDGWVDTPNTEIAPVVLDAVALYEKSKQPPQFVKLPIEIK